MNKISFLKLPWLVQKEVLSNMTMNELFTFSFSSSIVFSLIGQIQWRSTGVTFNFEAETLRIYFHTTRFASLLQEHYFLVWMKTGVVEYCQSPTIRFMVSNSLQEIHEETITLTLQKHISCAFSKCRDLIYNVDIFYGFEHYKWMSSLNTAWIDDPTTTELEAFTKAHPDLEMLTVQGDIIGDLSSDSNMFNARNIHMYIYEKPFTEYVRYFKARHALFNAATKSFHVKEFIRNWLRGMYSDNLTFVHIDQEDGEVFHPTLLEGLELIRWDSSIFPNEYRMEKRDKFLTKCPKTYSIVNAYYMIRETDGKVLSVSFDRITVEFCVWNPEDLVVLA